MFRFVKEKSLQNDKPSKKHFGLKALSLAAIFSASSAFAVTPVVPDFTPPSSLKLEKVPEPSNLNHFVKDKNVAVALGKALFWEMRIGSDGEKACATCHFSAGVDNRLKNQLAPAADRMGFHTRRANETLKFDEFPFTKFSDVTKNDKTGGNLVRDVRDVTGSQGVFDTTFVDAIAGEVADVEKINFNEVFKIRNLGAEQTFDDSLQVYQVTPRATPTMINAIFNLRNFWDGRAQTIFNGANPFGKRDPQAGVYITKNGNPVKTKITINDSSIASLATGPALSTIEESAKERIWPNIGRRLLPMRILAGQEVSPTDSVLGPWAKTDGTGGLNDGIDYQLAVRLAFQDNLWNSGKPVSINGMQFSQAEANFSLFFGLAVQSYIATLVSDDAPFDRYMDGDADALTKKQINGLKVFMDKGKCVNCHGGPVFTNAAIKRDSKLGKTSRISRMIMGNGEEAVYDEGFYNIGVTRTEDDAGVGGKDPFGNPLSFTRLAKVSTSNFYWKELDLPNVSGITSNERDAVQGAFKVPTLRNIALTAPYFHNGGYATLTQVVEFYNRGGNFPHNNRDDLTSDIEPLGLSDTEISDLVAFLQSLTDERVTNHKAPFDHPMVEIADGFAGDENGTDQIDFIEDGIGAAADIGLEIPAVGAEGYNNVEATVPTFSKRLGAFEPEPKPEPKPEPLPVPDYTKLIKCGSENGTCNLTHAPKPAIVYYADNLFDLKLKRFYTGLTGITEDSIACNNATFGDPKKGHPKECYYVK